MAKPSSSADKDETGEQGGEARRFPPFAALRAFEMVFRVGGIRRAASRLGVNHAVVSRHLKMLEEWLGAPLLTRIDNRPVLTEAGRAYHARVSQLLADLALATREFTNTQNNDPIRIWCVHGLAIQWLSAQLADFERAHPDIQVELKSTDVPANLQVHEADIDIRYMRDSEAIESASRGLRSFELARPPIVPVASPDFAAGLTLTQPADLLDLVLLHEDNRSEWQEWLRLNGVDLPAQIGGPLCWQAHLCVDAARQGRGLALASRFLVDSDLARGALVEVVVPGATPVPLGSYQLTMREERWSAAIFAALRRFLRDRADQVGAPSV